MAIPGAEETLRAILDGDKKKMVPRAEVSKV